MFQRATKDRKGESLAPKKDWRKGHSNKTPDLDKFKEFAQENQGLTATAMAEKLGNLSVKTVCKWLKGIGFTRKKSYGYRERNEKNLAVYREELGTKNSGTIVYIDESEIDDNEEYLYAWGIKGARVYAMKPGFK